MTWSILRFNMVNLGVSSPVFIWFGNPFVHQNAALPTMDDLPHLVACFQVKRSWFDVLRCKGNWESHSDKSAPKSLGMWTMLWCWSRDVLVIYALSMIYIILIWINWMGIYQENRRWTWNTQKESQEISGGNFSLPRWFQMFTSVSQLSLPPVCQLQVWRIWKIHGEMNEVVLREGFFNCKHDSLWCWMFKRFFSQ